MASINLYKKHVATQKVGGYQNIFRFAPRNTFTTIAAPIASPLVSGDKVKIVDDHVFATDEGFIPWNCKLHSATITGETVGDPGAREMMWKFKFTLVGDSASTQEMIQDQLNDDLICLIKDATCGGGEYVQLGNECITPEFTVSFDGKTTADGQKEYTVEGQVKSAKYIYTGEVTDKPGA